MKDTVGDCIVTRMVGQGTQARRGNGRDDTVGVGKGRFLIKGKMTACKCNTAGAARLNGHRDRLQRTLKGEFRLCAIQEGHMIE